MNDDKIRPLTDEQLKNVVGGIDPHEFGINYISNFKNKVDRKALYERLKERKIAVPEENELLDK